jgi:hypothetical protein
MNKGRLGLRENKMNTFKGWEEEKKQTQIRRG